MKEKQHINQNIFYASIIYHNGYPAVMIRKIISDKEVIKKLSLEILKKGYFEFEGVLIFRNPIVAIRELKNKNLLDIDFNEIFNFKY